MWRPAGLALAAILTAGIAHAGPAPCNMGEIVVTEGLALRTAHSLHPDRLGPDFSEAAAHRTQILLDVRAVLNAGDDETLRRFTTGKGPAGIQGEAYYAAWAVTGFWLAHGETLAEIAQVKGKDAPARVAEAIDLMLKEPR